MNGTFLHAVYLHGPLLCVAPGAAHACCAKLLAVQRYKQGLASLCAHLVQLSACTNGTFHMCCPALRFVWRATVALSLPGRRASCVYTAYLGAAALCEAAYKACASQRPAMLCVCLFANRFANCTTLLMGRTIQGHHLQCLYGHSFLLPLQLVLLQRLQLASWLEALTDAPVLLNSCLICWNVRRKVLLDVQAHAGCAVCNADQASEC